MAAFGDEAGQAASQVRRAGLVVVERGAGSSRAGTAVRADIEHRSLARFYGDRAGLDTEDVSGLAAAFAVRGETEVAGRCLALRAGDSENVRLDHGAARTVIGHREFPYRFTAPSNHGPQEPVRTVPHASSESDGSPPDSPKRILTHVIGRGELGGRDALAVRPRSTEQSLRSCCARFASEPLASVKKTSATLRTHATRSHPRRTQTSPSASMRINLITTDRSYAQGPEDAQPPTSSTIHPCWQLEASKASG